MSAYSCKKKIKMSQITTIIVTDLSIHNISGLIGLLSSLSLNAQVTKVDIYGPSGLENYIFLGSKYSQTSFHYKLRINIIPVRLRYKPFSAGCYMSLCISCFGFNAFDCTIMTTEKPGRFNLMKALRYNLPLGPLFSCLKVGYSFLLPDGYMIYGDNFVNDYFPGIKVSFSYTYMGRLSTEIIRNATYVFSFLQ